MNALYHGRYADTIRYAVKKQFWGYTKLLLRPFYSATMQRNICRCPRIPREECGINLATNVYLPEIYIRLSAAKPLPNYVLLL